MLWLAQTLAAECVERLPEAVVAEVGRIEDDAEPLHLLQQRPARFADAASGIGSLRVRAGTVVRRPDRPQAVVPRPLDVIQRDQRVGAFEAANVADGQLRGERIRRRAPLRQMGVELGRRRDLPHLAAPLHLAIPRQLRLRHRPRLFRRVPAGQPVGELHVAGDLRRHDDADAAAAQLVERHRAARAIGAIRHPPFAHPDFIDGPRQVAVPFDGVHGKVEVGVENHGIDD